MLVWFATSVAVCYNNSENTENAVSSSDEEDGIVYIIDFPDLIPETLLKTIV